LTWPPTWHSAPEVASSRGFDTIEFIETVCRVTKDSIGGRAGDLIKLRDWQQNLLIELLSERPDGRLKHRQALVGMPRKNGKSSLTAPLALEHVLFGPMGSEVYSCAADKEQAKIVFGTAKRMVELDPQLSQVLNTYRDVIENPTTGSVYRALSSEAYTKEGLNPSLVIFDEVHAQPNRELWDVMSLALGARREPLMIGITTAGVIYDTTGEESLCYGMYLHGKDVARGMIEDPTFYFAWWESEKDYKDPNAWREANPGFDDIVSAEDFESAVIKTPEPEFRTKRLNQFVGTMNAWLPGNAWNARKSDRKIDDTPVIMGFDGSYNNDSTAIVIASIEPKPHIQTVAVWERPKNATEEWQVPILEVEDKIREVCKTFTVKKIYCDPYRWARTMQILLSERLPVEEFPQTPERMIKATDSFYKAVMTGMLTHDGNPTMARHQDNAVLKISPRGAMLAKDAKDSRRKIDLAVAALMAYYWAEHFANKRKRKISELVH
jgi:phage terminase large subunit-like protein